MIFEGVELPSLLTREKAAAVLHVDIATIEQWIESGRLCGVRTNGRIRVLTSSIEDRKGLRTTSLPNQECS
jgi:excisionase family DNA binding protein